MKKCLFLFVLILVISCTSSVQKADAPHPQIVVLSPELAEIVCALGAEEHIIGIVQECDYPQTLQKKLSVGCFSSPNIEKITALQPDAVLCTGMEQDVLTYKLKNLGLEVDQFFPSSLETLFETITSIGELVHRENVADSLVQNMQQTIQNIPSYQTSPSIYIEIYNKPLMTASSDSFVGDLLRAAGFKNIFPELPREYCAVSSEKIVERNPDIILITYPNVAKNDIMNRLGWQAITAVKNGNVFTTEDIDPDLILRAGPRIVQGIQKLNELSSEK